MEITSVRYQGYLSVSGCEENVLIFDIVDGSILRCWSSISASKLKINIALLLPERTLKDAPQMDIANIVIAIDYNILWL